MYRCDDAVVSGTTLAIRQVDGILVADFSHKDRSYVLEGIVVKVTFKISPGPTTLFYATDLEQNAPKIRAYARRILPLWVLSLP
jgi:hypothetical protein